MKNLLGAFLLVAALQTAFASPKNPPSTGRTIKDLPHFPHEVLKNEISHALYRSIEVSPVEAWLEARASLYGSGSANAKIIHSEANGIYDKMLLEMANGYTVSGAEETESRIEGDTLNVHLLIFKISDGRLGICFAHTDDARYNGYRQTGQAWVGILQNGHWRTVSKPDRH